MMAIRGYINRMVNKISDYIQEVKYKIERYIKEDEESKGSMQEDFLGNKTYVKNETIKRSEISKLRKEKETGFESYKNTLNKSTLTLEELRERSKPLTEEGLRIQNQFKEACERCKLKGGDIRYELEPPFNKTVILFLGEDVLHLSEEGIYSAFGSPYYIPKTMSKSWGLTRIVNTLGDKYFKLFIDLVTIYDISVYKELTHQKEETYA